VQEEADLEVGPLLAQHRRDELELVVLHPHRRALGGDLGRRVGEPLVDLHVGVPPVAVEGGLRHDVVVERPEGAVGEALVVVLDLFGGQLDGVQQQAVVFERRHLGVRDAGPADPGAAV
jgi:hypothetical protein